MNTLADAFEHTLKDIYYAENAILKAGPEVAAKVGSAELKTAIMDHMKDTEAQVTMLGEVFGTIGVKPSGDKCDAIEGLVKEADGIVKQAEGVALDAAVIGALQAIEHYEIARYGTLREWAMTLGNREAYDTLGRILDMEKAANGKLTGLAVASVNEAGDRPGKRRASA